MHSELSKYIEDFTDFVEFERLCCDVLALLGYEGIDPQGLGRIDGGKDAVLHHATRGRIVFHFSLRADWQVKALEDIKRVAQNNIRFNQMVFFTNRKASAKQKDRLKAECKDLLQCELEIFDQERLRIVLATNESLRARYFPDYFVASEVVRRLTDTIHSLVKQGLAIPETSHWRNAPKLVRQTIADVLDLAASGNIAEVLERASDMTKTARSFADSIVWGLSAIGCVCFEKGDLSAAETVWRQALSIDSRNFGVNFNMGVLMEWNDKSRRYGRGFRAKEAIDFYDRALAVASTREQEADCLDNQGVVLLKIGQEETAREKFSGAQEKCPSHLSSRLNLATQTDSWETQQEVYLSLVDTPLGETARVNLALTYVEQQKWGDALVCLRHMKTRRNWVECTMLLCKIALGREKLKKARFYAEQALVQDPDRAHVHFLLGKLFHAENNARSAIPCYQTAIALDPLWTEPYVELAGLLHEQKTQASSRQCIEVLEAALKIRPNLINAHNNIGNAYVELGMLASARVEYNKEMELHHDNKLAHFNLGYLAEFNNSGIRYGAGARLFEAIDHYREALKFAPEYFPALFNLGTDLSLIGKDEEAAEILKAALKISPENDSVLANLGVAYEKLGRRAEAINCFNKALCVNPSNRYATCNLQNLV